MQTRPSSPRAITARLEDDSSPCPLDWRFEGENLSILLSWDYPWKTSGPFYQLLTFPPERLWERMGPELRRQTGHLKSRYGRIMGAQMQRQVRTALERDLLKFQQAFRQFKVQFGLDNLKIFAYRSRCFPLQLAGKLISASTAKRDFLIWLLQAENVVLWRQVFGSLLHILIS